MRLQKYNEAFEDLNSAIRLAPKNSDYFANFGYVLFKLGKYREAIDAETNALKLDEKNFTANYQLGRFLLRSGDKKSFVEAAKYLRRAQELDPRQYEVRFELIAVYRELGDVASALVQLDVLQEALPSEARVNYVAGLLSIDRNELSAAETSFREAVRKDPNLFGARQDLGLLYVKQNRWLQASETFDEMGKRQPDSSVAAYFSALSFYNLKKVPEAERETRRALRLDPTSADAHTLLGVILASRGNADAEAIDSLSQAVLLQPNNFDALFYLGRVQYVTKDFLNAVKNLRAAIILQPGNIEARFFCGTALEAAGDLDAALTEYNEIVKLDEKSAYGQIGLGALLLKQGKTDEAIVALKNAVRINSGNFEANWAIGRAFILKENFSEAANALQRAVALAPNRTDARYQLGLALRRLGRTAEAAKEFALVDKLNKEFREGKQP
jgi:tetratricopeptide (TPR) repeat protein